MKDTSTVQTRRDRLLLSVIVPVFNEERTVDEVLRCLRDGPILDKEVIVVDDGSTDRTPEILQRWASEPGFSLFSHSKNCGKGAAIRTALNHSVGTFTIIQDADLEYDTGDLARLVQFLEFGTNPVVYGSRYLCCNAHRPWDKFRVAVAALNILFRRLYGQNLTDVATCYKGLRTDLLRQLDLRSDRFEVCAEITAKLGRLRIPIEEIPISYWPRTKAEGKKIGWKDVWPTFWTMVKWRFIPFSIKDIGHIEQEKISNAHAPTLTDVRNN